MHTLAQRIRQVPAVGIINVQHESQQSSLYVLFGKLLYSKVTCCSFIFLSFKFIIIFCLQDKSPLGDCCKIFTLWYLVMAS